MTPSGCVASEPYLVERDSYEIDLGKQYLCNGDTLYLNGFAFYKKGKQKFTTKTVEFGCDSVVNFEILIDNPSTTIETHTLCTGSSWPIGNVMVTESGRYMDTLRTASGCDSLIRTVNLFFEDLEPLESDVEICSGDTFIFHDISETTPGEYSTTVMSGTGCDTTYVFNLSVVQPVPEEINEVICQGGLYEYGDISTSDAGTHTTILKSTTGCDSVEVTVNLEVSPPEQYVFEETICQGKTFTYRDIEETEEGTYTTLSTAGLCDSLIVINLTVSDADRQTETETICPGINFDWRGETYTTAGTYEVLEDMPGECNILHVLELSIADLTPIVEDHVICQGDIVEKGDEKIDQAGTYEVLVRTPGACDELYELNVTVLPTTFGAVETVLCNGNTFELYDLVADAPGSYRAMTTNAQGCDSIINVEILANSLVPTIENAAICPGESISFHGNDYDAAGSYDVTLTNQYDCDSIVTLELAISSAIPVTRDYEICRGDTLKYNGLALAESGTAVTLNLLVLDQSYADLTREMCFGDTTFLNDIVATEEGSYMTIMQNMAGCDSIVTMELIVHYDTPTSFTEQICEGDVYSNANIEATIAGRYEDTLMSSSGCDSTIVIDLQVLPLNQGAYEFAICPGDVLSFYGDEISEPGSYTKRFSNAVGCDSVVTYTVEYDGGIGDVEVEPEYTINRGAAVDLEPLFVDESFVSYMWLDAEGEIMSIEKELTNFMPDADTNISFVATNANGCEVEKRVRITVELVINIFIPNVITPDTDSYDSNFNIRANESVVGIKDIQIYDRWGELMYGSEHQGSLDDYLGWDGKYKYEKVLPGVYTYAVVFEIIDGTYVKKAGDLTVIR